MPSNGNNKGLMQRVTDSIFKQKSEERLIELFQYGIRLNKDVKLATRIEMIDIVVEKIKTGTSIDEKVDLVDQLVHSVTAPYARGNSPVFIYWNDIMAEWRDFKRLRTAEPSNSYFTKEARNQLIDNWGYRDVIKYGLMIVDMEWQDRDVTDANMAIIQSIMPMGYGAVIPSSHVPPTKPAEVVYPEKLDAGLKR